MRLRLLAAAYRRGVQPRLKAFQIGFKSVSNRLFQIGFKSCVRLGSKCPKESMKPTRLRPTRPGATLLSCRWRPLRLAAAPTPAPKED